MHQTTAKHHRSGSSKDPNTVDVAQDSARIGFWCPPHGDCTGHCPHRLLGPSPTAIPRSLATNCLWCLAPGQSHGALHSLAFGAQPHYPAPNGFLASTPRQSHGALPGIWDAAPRRSHGAVPPTAFRPQPSAPSLAAYRALLPTACGAEPHGNRRGPCPHWLLARSYTSVARSRAHITFWAPTPRESPKPLPPTASRAQPHSSPTRPCPQWRRPHGAGFGPCP